MFQKPKIGFYSIGYNGYWAQFKGLEERLLQYSKDIEKKLRQYADVISAGLVDSVEKSKKAGHLFKENDVELLFCHCATYSVSSNMLPAAQIAGCTVIMLNLQPARVVDCENVTEIGECLEMITSAAIPEMTAVLIRNEIPFSLITGILYDDTAADQEIKQWCDAARARSVIRGSKIAMLGQPFEGMMDLYVDRTNLKRRLNIETVSIEHTAILDAGEVTDLEEAAAAKEILNFFEHPDISENEILNAAKVYVIMRKLVEKTGITALSYHYSGKIAKELEDIVGTSNIAFSLLSNKGIPCCVEGDVKSSIASLILKTLTGAAQLSELYTIDYDKDIVFIAHSGSGDAGISGKKPLLKKTEVFHGKTGKGLLTQFYVQEGDVTLISLTQDGEGNFSLVCAEGVCVPGKLLKVGDTNARVYFPGGARNFINEWCKTGPTHHSVMTLGHHSALLEKAAKILNCRFVRVV